MLVVRSCVCVDSCKISNFNHSPTMFVESVLYDNDIGTKIQHLYSFALRLIQCDENFCSQNAVCAVDLFFFIIIFFSLDYMFGSPFLMSFALAYAINYTHAHNTQNQHGRVKKKFSLLSKKKTSWHIFYRKQERKTVLCSRFSYSLNNSLNTSKSAIDLALWKP